jgi:hypothetical protein
MSGWSVVSNHVFSTQTGVPANGSWIVDPKICEHREESKLKVEPSSSRFGLRALGDPFGVPALAVFTRQPAKAGTPNQP